MTAPDYISPVVGYRVWQWDATGLKSLNGIGWHPGRAFAAECRTQGCNEAPRSNCTCGIYASKNLDHLRQLGYMQHRIYGEVSLWGGVVEHEEGWRAQFAYPRKLTVPLSMVPLSMSKVELWLAALSAYGCDIFIDGETRVLPLWRTSFAIDANGLDLLMRRCSDWYARRAERRRIKPGDRVAVLGHGIAVVEQADKDLVQAILGNTNVLTIERETIVWNDQNSRWEMRGGAGISLTGRRRLQSGTITQFS